MHHPESRDPRLAGRLRLNPGGVADRDVLGDRGIPRNYKEIPVNAPRSPVHAYSKDGAMRIRNASDPVYVPSTKGGPQADPAAAAEITSHADGDMVRSAYTLRPDDDDWGQAGTLVRQVMDDDARDRLVANIAGHLLDGVSEPVLERAFDYWKNVDPTIGERVEKSVRQGQA